MEQFGKSAAWSHFIPGLGSNINTEMKISFNQNYRGGGEECP